METDFWNTKPTFQNLILPHTLANIKLINPLPMWEVLPISSKLLTSTYSTKSKL